VKGVIHDLALCAGIGGIELGLKIALGDRIRTVCYVEREAFAAAALVARMEDKILDKAPIWDDLKSFDGKPWRGKVDLITGGYPCQPFSQAGKGLAAQDPRHLWPEFKRIIGEIGPSLVFCENVQGHVKRGFEAVLDDLHSLGYSVTAGVFSASEVGAPHERRRLFFLADRDGERCKGGIRSKMGDPSSTRLEGRRLHTLSGLNKKQPWPPGPEDKSAWLQVRERTPHLEPAIRRVANGIPDRVDRLRALGNGVLPLVAAHAFATLANAAGILSDDMIERAA
jgi:DNA (cytosine-5)-methyltransferase 1